MLRTALKPRWIAALIGALIVSGIFVLLSQWQFSRSTSDAPPPPAVTEKSRLLLDVLTPGMPLPASVADQMVTATGQFDPSRQVLVRDRIEDGEKGWWVVTAFLVDDAPSVGGEGGVVIPVARGWVASPEEAPGPPEGTVRLTGRLLPSEGPVPSDGSAQDQVGSLSVAELVNRWDAPSYAAFLSSTAETTAQGDESAAAGIGPLKALGIGPQPLQTPVNWLNIFYAVEWVVFAGFAVFLWWRLVRDDFERERDALADAIDDHRSESGDRPGNGGTP